jgi:hypothetical protein
MASHTRLGFLVPPGNPTVEPEMIEMAPPGVSVHFSRMIAHGPTGTLEGQEELNRTQIEHIGESAELLAMVKPNVIMLAHTASVAPSFGVELTPIDTRNTDEIERAVAREANSGLIVVTGTSAIVHRALIISLAARHGLPAVYQVADRFNREQHCPPARPVAFEAMSPCSGRKRRLANGRPRLLLLRREMCGRRQLQHGRALALAQPGEQHHLPVREFQRIVVGHGVVQVDLPEAREPLSDLLVRQNADSKRGLALDVLLECDLGAGEQANRHMRLADRGEAAGNGIAELRRHQLVLDLGRPGHGMVQTVITHRRAPLPVSGLPDERMIAIFRVARKPDARVDRYRLSGRPVAHLNLKLSRLNWPTDRQPISFMSRSISARRFSSALSTPA